MEAPLSSKNVECGLECKICLSPLYNAINVDPCNHKFHPACIRKWLGSQAVDNQKCPLCKQDIVLGNRDPVIEGLARDVFGEPSEESATDGTQLAEPPADSVPTPALDAQRAPAIEYQVEPSEESDVPPEPPEYGQIQSGPARLGMNASAEDEEYYISSRPVRHTLLYVCGGIGGGLVGACPTGTATACLSCWGAAPGVIAGWAIATAATGGAGCLAGVTVVAVKLHKR